MRFPWQRKAPQVTPAEAARILSERRVTRERNHIIDTANEIRARMGKAPIPRRPE